MYPYEPIHLIALHHDTRDPVIYYSRLTLSSLANDQVIINFHQIPCLVHIYWLLPPSLWGAGPMLLLVLPTETEDRAVDDKRGNFLLTHTNVVRNLP